MSPAADTIDKCNAHAINKVWTLRDRESNQGPAKCVERLV